MKVSNWIPKKKDHRYAYLTFQAKLIKKHFQFLTCKIEYNVLKCKGWLQPDDCINRYQVLIEYVLGKEPKTTILSPDILPNRTIHMYRDHSLCLLYPPDLKWTEQTKVYEYTIPWISEWIVYYEIYLLNGNHWEGRESPEHFKESQKNTNEDFD